MKRCSPSLAIKKMQIRDHFTPTGMAISKKTDNNKAGESMVKLNQHTVPVGMESDAAVFEKSMANPEISLLGTCPKENTNPHKQLHMDIHSSSIILNTKRQN
jgi:hypothetical protein